MARLPEQRVFDNFARLLDQQPEMDYDRLEPISGCGLPDMVTTNTRIMRIVFWELKASENLKNGHIKVLDWKSPQRQWASRCVRSGGTYWILVGEFDKNGKVCDLWALDPRYFNDMPVNRTTFIPEVTSYSTNIFGPGAIPVFCRPSA